MGTQAFSSATGQPSKALGLARQVPATITRLILGAARP